MRVAVLNDIHGNLPALDAVLAEVEQAGVDAIVVGGDLVWGPLPRETLERLMALYDRATFLMGNADRDVVEAFDGVAPEHEAVSAYCAGRISRTEREFLAGLTATVALDVDGLGDTLFCHGSPRSDTERITTATPDARLRGILEGVGESVVVCGHTHRDERLRFGPCSGLTSNCGARTTTSARRLTHFARAGCPSTWSKSYASASSSPPIPTKSPSTSSRGPDPTERAHG